MKTAKCGCLYSGAIQMCHLHATAHELLEACKTQLKYLRNGARYFNLLKVIEKAEGDKI